MSDMEKEHMVEAGASETPSPTPPPPSRERGLHSQPESAAPLPLAGEGLGRGQAGEDSDWRDGVADPELRQRLDRYGSLEDLARHNLTLRRRLSRAVSLPEEDAGEEELAEFRARLGVPEGPEGYDFEAAGDLPAELAGPDDGAELEEFRAVAHALGLTRDQFAGLMDWRQELLAGLGERLAEAQTRARDVAEAALRREWGRDYTRNLNLSRRALREFGGPGLEAFLSRARVDGGRLGDHPELLRWAAAAGGALAEANFRSGGGQGGLSIEDQRQRLTQAIHEARATGNAARARELDAERRALTQGAYGG